MVERDGGGEREAVMMTETMQQVELIRSEILSMILDDRGLTFRLRVRPRAFKCPAIFVRATFKRLLSLAGHRSAKAVVSGSPLEQVDEHHLLVVDH